MKGAENMDENYINEEEITEEETAAEDTEMEAIADEDNTERLREEDIRRRREGRADDIVSMQAVLCLIMAAGLVVLNIAKPDIAEEFIGFLRGLSTVDKDIIPNPVDHIIEFVKNL